MAYTTRNYSGRTNLRWNILARISRNIEHCSLFFFFVVHNSLSTYSGVFQIQFSFIGTVVGNRSTLFVCPLDSCTWITLIVLLKKENSGREKILRFNTEIARRVSLRIIRVSLIRRQSDLCNYRELKRIKKSRTSKKPRRADGELISQPDISEIEIVRMNCSA